MTGFWSGCHGRFAYLSVCSSQMAFSSRVRVYHAWQNADAELRRVKQAHERSRAQGKAAPEKTDRLKHTYSQIGDVRPFSPTPLPLVAAHSQTRYLPGRRSAACWTRSTSLSTCRVW